MNERSIIWDLISNDRASATNSKVASSFDHLERHTSNLGATMGRVAGAAKWMGAGLVAAGGLAVTSGVKTLASLETTQVGFTTLLGSAKKANDYLTWMKQFAAATPFELAGLTDSARLLLGVGVKAKTTKEILQDFGDTAGAVGMDADHFQMAMLAVSQSLAAGHIKLGDMNQLMNDGIPIWKLLSEAMGKPVPKIQALISKGKLATDDVFPKLLAVMHKDYGGAMGRQSETLTGLWSTLMDTVNLGMADALQPAEGFMKGALTTAIKTAGSALHGLPGKIHEIKDAAKGLHLDKLLGDAKDLTKAAEGWASPIILGLREGIEHGQWTGFWPVIESKIFGGAGAGGAGLGGLVSKLGAMLAGVDWMKVGEKVGGQAFPFAIGFVNSLLTGVVTAFRKHPLDTVLGILAVIPAGRVAGLLSKGLKPGILKGILDVFGWAGKKLEKPVFGLLKYLGRALLDGFRKEAPEVVSGTKSLIETGILKVWYRAEGVKKAVGSLFRILAEAPGRLAGRIVTAMKTLGRHVVEGLVIGMRGAIPAVASAAAAVAMAVPNKVMNLLHIRSPSRVMMVLGGHTMQGYINGIRGKKKELHAALEDVKADLQKQISKWSGIYSEHKQKLHDLKSAYKDLKGSIRDAFAGTSITDRGASLANVLSSYTGDITKSAAAASALARLKKMGLRTDLLTQLGQGGTGALGLEQSILAGGKGGIKALNKQQATLVGLGNKAGATVAEATYARAIAAETRETKHLKKALDDLRKEVASLTKAMRQPGNVDAAKLRAALNRVLRQASALAG